MCNGAAVQQRLQHSADTQRRAGRPWPRRPPDHRRRRWELISTTRRPGATSSCSTIGTSAADRTPARSAISVVQLHERRHQARRNLRLESTTYFGAFYNTLTASSDSRLSCRAATPRWAGCRAIPGATPPTMAFVRARNSSRRRADGGSGDRLGNDASQGIELPIQHRTGRADIFRRSAAGNFRTPRPRSRWSTSRIPNGCSVDASPPAMERRRSETSLSLRAGKTATTRSSRRRRTSATTRFRLDAEQRAQVQRDRLRILPNELVTQATPAR